MIGTARPSVNFFMNKFRKLGFIDYNGTLEVHPSAVFDAICETLVEYSKRNLKPGLMSSDMRQLTPEHLQIQKIADLDGATAERGLQLLWPP
jgi:hypothetical protein